MTLPTLTGVGRLTDDPELRFAGNGTAVCKVRLAFNSRRKNDQTGQWEDADVAYIDGVLFKQAAENAAEALARGIEVAVTGRLKTEQWEDRETGAKRSRLSLVIDSIGPVISNFQTAKVSKMDRSSGSSGGQSGGGGFADDPWASAAPAASKGGSNFNDEPPF